MNSLLKHGSIVFISIIIANLLAYVLQIYFGRVLGPEGYGVFGSLMAILIIMSIPIMVISNIFTKFVSKYKAEEHYGKINTLIFSSLKKLIIYGVLGFLVVSVLSPFIASYLNISEKLPIIFVGIVLIFSVLLPIVRGSLQGLQKFNSLAFNNVFESLVRLVLGVILVRFGVSGAILSYGLGYLGAFLIGFVSLRFLFGKSGKIDVSEIYKYGYPVLISVICLSVLLNLPTIFVKHYFSAIEAGVWNAALTLSRILQYVGGAFMGVMFAKVSEKHAKKEETLHIMHYSLGCVGLIGLIVVGLFYWIPGLIVGGLFSSGYEGAYKILWWFGLVLLSYALNMILVNYELAIHRSKVFIGLIVLTILEIGLVLLLHQSLFSVLMVMLFVNACLFVLELVRTSNLLSRYSHRH